MLTRLGPHGEVGNGNVGAWGSVGADDLDGTTRASAGFGTLPVLNVVSRDRL